MDTFNINLTSLINQQVKPEEAEHPSAAMRKLYGANKQAGSGNVGSVKEVPLTAAAIPSLLTRAKLSRLTRRLEERRLAKLERKRQLRKKGQKRSRGQYHWRRKALTKKNYNRKRYEQDAGWGAIMSTRAAKRLDKELWDKYIGECFREYSPKYLIVKKIKRPPGFGQSAYYGNKEFPLTVYSFRVHHATLGVVWDGEEQRKIDGVDILRIPQNDRQ